MHDDPVLNDAQRRNLSITLRIIEQSLDEITGLAEREGVQGGILYRLVNDLSPASMEEIQTQAQLIRERIASLTMQLHLEPDERTVSRIVWAKLNYCWEILQKADSQGLRAYGPVSVGLDEAIDPHIAALVALVVGLLRLLEREAGK